MINLRILVSCGSLICIAFGTLLGSRLEAAQQRSPNFVVILTDDQSWVGSSLQIDPMDPQTRSGYYRTPRIEGLGKTGMSFTRGYSPAPFCCPTRRSLLIGQTPARHIYQKDQRNWTTIFRKQLTLPQMLKQANEKYRTAHFGKWDMRYDEVTPEEMGYDVSDGYTSNATGGGKGTGGPAAKDDPKLIFGITQRTCGFMEKQAKAGHPFFVQVSHYAVHLDIFYRRKSLEKAWGWKPGRKHSIPDFAAMTSDVDEGIGRVLDKIKSLGVQDSTYIFLLSDNGGKNSIPGQKGKELHRNHPLRDGKGSMYEGGIRVPFIVSGPGVRAGSVSRVPVTGLDIFPTIADLAGYRQALPKKLDGGSMTRVMSNGGRGEIERNQPFLLFHQAVARKAQSALILGNHKLVKTWEGNRLELFDLSKSASEDKNISRVLPAKTRELDALMVRFLDDVKAETRKTGTKKDAHEKAKPLKSVSRKEAGATSSRPECSVPGDRRSERLGWRGGWASTGQDAKFRAVDLEERLLQQRALRRPGLLGVTALIAQRAADIDHWVVFQHVKKTGGLQEDVGRDPSPANAFQAPWLQDHVNRQDNS